MALPSLFVSSGQGRASYGGERTGLDTKGLLTFVRGLGRITYSIDEPSPIKTQTQQNQEGDHEMPNKLEIQEGPVVM
jgi:hypothetical protein